LDLIICHDERGVYPHTKGSSMDEDPIEIAKEVLAEAEAEDVCAHCSKPTSGRLIIETDQFRRGENICDECAKALLEWL
jgi:hypothetical protein